MSNHPYLSSSQHPVPATGGERLAAVLAHSAIFWGPVLVPLVIWLLAPSGALGPSYVKHQAMQALLWHVFSWVIGGVLWGAVGVFFAIVLIGWPFALLFAIIASVFSLWVLVIAFIATWKSFQGVPYQLPVVGKLNF